MAKKKELTYGEKAAGLDKDDATKEITACRTTFAAAIDQLNDLREKASDEQKRKITDGILITTTAMRKALSAVSHKDR